MRRKIVMALALLAGVTNAVADIVVSDVEVFSGWPWKEVAIGYTITGTTNVPTFVRMTAIDHIANKTYAAMTLTGAETREGRHVMRWNPSVDGVCISSPKVSFTITISDEVVYLIIDLSGGSSAMRYSTAFRGDVPSGGWSDEYKTEKLVLRRIEKKEGPFFVGVFEVTQAQYELVMGSNPSGYKGELRPVDCVSYNAIRGSSEGSKWPESDSVDETSFLGKLRVKTGLMFDLPTYAQWEYACRAGTTSDFNNGRSSEADLKLLGRYRDNHRDGKGEYSDAHTTVGSYLPNAWGLYDMHGNVREWCLDGQDFYGYVNRKSCGGSYGDVAGDCTSSGWWNDPPSSVKPCLGFRLFLPLVK